MEAWGNTQCQIQDNSRMFFSSESWFESFPNAHWVVSVDLTKIDIRSITLHTYTFPRTHMSVCTSLRSQLTYEWKFSNKRLFVSFTLFYSFFFFVFFCFDLTNHHYVRRWIRECSLNFYHGRHAVPLRALDSGVEGPRFEFWLAWTRKWALDEWIMQPSE